MSATKPLVIYIGQSLWAGAWVDELRQKGHTVLPLELAGFDLLLDPRAARFLPGMEQFLDEFVKGARKVRYPEKKGA